MADGLEKEFKPMLANDTNYGGRISCPSRLFVRLDVAAVFALPGSDRGHEITP
jgi:hypothetical protein